MPGSSEPSTSLEEVLSDGHVARRRSRYGNWAGTILRPPSTPHVLCLAVNFLAMTASDHRLHRGLPPRDRKHTMSFSNSRFWSWSAVLGDTVTAGPASGQTRKPARFYAYRDPTVLKGVQYVRCSIVDP